MKTAAMTLLLLLLVSVAPAQQLLRLEDAVSIGLENNHRIVIARNDAEMAQNNTTRGSAGFLPTLDATGNWSLARSEQETNSPFSFGNSDTRTASAQLALNWTLFDGFRMFAENARYRQLAVLGEAQTRNTVEQTVVGIVAAYMRVVQEARLLDALTRVLDISRTRYEKESVRRELGGSASDYFNARIAFNTDSSAFLMQELQLRIARQELNLLLGRPVDTDFDVVRDIALPSVPSRAEDALSRARSRNAEVNVMRQNLRVAETAVSSSRSTFFPRVNFFANYGYSDRLTGTSDERFSGDISTQSADASLGLSLSFNLFNGFRNSTDVENAQLERHSAATALQEAEYRLEALIREQIHTLETRLQAAGLAENSLEAATSNLALQVERYETGTVTSLEFRDAQLQFVRAETAHIVALFQARIASLELQRLTGDISLR
jgi:outer membrane protein TolC